MWLLQMMMAWLQAPLTCNLLFAALAICQAWGADGRVVAVLTALLCLALAVG